MAYRIIDTRKEMGFVRIASAPFLLWAFYHATYKDGGRLRGVSFGRYAMRRGALAAARRRGLGEELKE